MERYIPISSFQGLYHPVKAKITGPRVCTFAPYLYKLSVTGGIASGKSSLLQILKSNVRNLVMLDCDKLAHNTYQPGTPTYEKLIATFGKDILGKHNYQIDRRKLSSIVFNDKMSLRQLNDIVWPEIIKNLKKKIICCEAQGFPIIVIEAALLFESGMDAYADEVWVLGVPDEEAERRVTVRGFSVEEARMRIKAQWDLKSRRELGDFFIDTYRMTREDNAVRILSRMKEIEEIASERQRNRKNEGMPETERTDCNPTACRCELVKREEM